MDKKSSEFHVHDLNIVDEDAEKTKQNPRIHDLVHWVKLALEYKMTEKKLLNASLMLIFALMMNQMNPFHRSFPASVPPSQPWVI